MKMVKKATPRKVTSQAKPMSKDMMKMPKNMPPKGMPPKKMPMHKTMKGY